MSIKPLTQKGFAALGGLLILIILVIVGGTGYYVYKAANKSTDNINNANLATQSSQAKSKKKAPKKATPAQNYLTIKEWGVRGKLDSTVTAQYALANDTNQVWANLSSDQLVAADPQCSVTRQAGGTITRAKSADHLYSQAGDDLGKTIQQAVNDGTLKKSKKVGDYYYWLDRGQAACSDSQTATDLQTKTQTAFETAILSFEALPTN
jgi:hypothetical protein